MFDDLFNFGKKVVKTAIYLPFIIISSILSNLHGQQSFGNELKEEETQETFLSLSYVTSYFKFLTPSYYFGSVFNIIKYFIIKIFKFIVVAWAFSVSSIIITLIAYYIISLPISIENLLSLSFNEDNNSQISTIYFNCTRLKENCSYIESRNYQVHFEFEILKNERSTDTSNFEVALNYQLDGEKNTIKKINFVEVNDFYLETFYRIINFPINVLGYKTTEIMSMKMINNLDNSNLGLDYVEVSIRNNKLNIKNPKLLFIPIVGFLRNIIWQFRLFTLPSLFFCCIFIQFFLYFCVKMLIWVYEKVTS